MILFVYILILYLSNATVESLTNDQLLGYFTYDDTRTWGLKNPVCNTGKRQSPINLSRSTSIHYREHNKKNNAETDLDDITEEKYGKIENAYDPSYHVSTEPLPPLLFINYDEPITGDLELTNSGRTVEFDINKNQTSSYITGGTLKNLYRAANIHLHWGSEHVRGAEHLIDSDQYDCEMHIVHHNTKYDNCPRKALHNHYDGLAVLGIFLKIDFALEENGSTIGLNKIFAAVSKVKHFLSNAHIDEPLTLQQILGNITTKSFFIYNGSVTTPPCAEAVTWIVFEEPIHISYEDVSKLWDIENKDGYLQNNFRPAQPLNGRTVYYKES